MSTLDWIVNGGAVVFCLLTGVFMIHIERGFRKRERQRQQSLEALGAANGVEPMDKK